MSKEKTTTNLITKEALLKKDVRALREIALKYDDFIPTTYSKRLLIEYILLQQG